ncbi:hypothetical protein [Winogradskyella sp. 3972H.M.0a.05]
MLIVLFDIIASVTNQLHKSSTDKIIPASGSVADAISSPLGA